MESNVVQCIYCCYRISTEEDALQCQGCLQWQHRTCCTDIPVSFYSKFYLAVLMKKDCPRWFCEHCAAWKNKHKNSNQQRKQQQIHFMKVGREKDDLRIPVSQPTPHIGSDDEFIYTRDQRCDMWVDTEHMYSSSSTQTVKEEPDEILIPPSRPIIDDAKVDVTYQLIRTSKGEKKVMDSQGNFYPYYKEDEEGVSVYMEQTSCLQTKIRIFENIRQFISVIRQSTKQPSHETQGSACYESQTEDALSDISNITEIYLDVDSISTTDDELDDLDEELPELTEYQSYLSSRTRQSVTPDMPHLLQETNHVPPTPFSTPSKQRSIPCDQQSINEGADSAIPGSSSEDNGRNQNTLDATIPYCDSSSDCEQNTSSPVHLTFTECNTLNPGTHRTMYDNHGYTYNLMSRVGHHLTWYCTQRLTCQCNASVVQHRDSRVIGNVIPHNHLNSPTDPPSTPAPTPMKSSVRHVNSPGDAELLTNVISQNYINSPTNPPTPPVPTQKGQTQPHQQQCTTTIGPPNNHQSEVEVSPTQPTHKKTDVDTDIEASSETGIIPPAEHSEHSANTSPVITSLPNHQYPDNKPRTEDSGVSPSESRKSRSRLQVEDHAIVQETDNRLICKGSKRHEEEGSSSETKSDDVIELSKILPVNTCSEVLGNELFDENADCSVSDIGEYIHNKDWRPVTNRDAPIRYHEIHSCKKVPQSVLVDSDGYVYTTKTEQITSSGTRIHWKCNVFGYNGRCKAFLTFNPVTQTNPQHEWCIQQDQCESVTRHNHDPNRLTALMTVLKMMLKRAIHCDMDSQGDTEHTLTAVTDKLHVTDRDLITSSPSYLKSLKNFIKLQQKKYENDN